MRSASIILLLSLLLGLPSTAAALLRLTWSDGTSNLTFSTPTRCTLVLQAESGETALPREWRLLWSADSAGVCPATLDPGSCPADTAVVAWFEPGTAADSNAHQFTAHLCSEGSPATTARFLFDQPGGSRGKFKVVYLDAGDSTRVLASGEATYNGGVAGEYPPIVLRTTATHASVSLEVEVTGSGLASTNALSVGAADDLWKVPMSVVSATASRVVAAADVPTPLSAACLKLTTSSELPGVGVFPGDGVTPQPDVELSEPIYLYDPDPTHYYPKDFSLFFNQVPTGNPHQPWQSVFHVMYIRQLIGGDVGTSLVHAWSYDNMQTWSYDLDAFGPSQIANQWDGFAVWAPSLVQVGFKTYMFYTGVKSNLDRDQSIGYATTTLYNDATTVWDREATPVFEAQDAVRWAGQDGATYNNAIQFRDPFVMPNPEDRNEYLLFNVGEDVTHPGTMTVGVARNKNGGFDDWEAIGHYLAADYDHLDQTTRAESPLAMQDPTGSLPWRLLVTRGDYNQSGSNSQYLLRQETGYSLTDTTLAAWPYRVTLYDYPPLGHESYLLGWAASEHLQVGNLHLLAGYDGQRIIIGQTYWSSNDFVLSTPQFTGVPPASSGGEPRFRIAEWRPAANRVALRLEGVSVSAPRVIVYDVTGRRVKVLAGGAQVEGTQEYAWDCRSEEGASVPSGIYFARLTGVGRPQVLRLCLVR